MTGNNQNQQSQSRPDNYEIAEQFLFDKYVTGKESKGESIRTLRSWKDDYYAYEDDFYHRLDDSKIKGQIAEFLHLLKLPCTVTAVSAIIMCLQHQTRVRDDVTLNSWLDGVDGARVFSVANGNISFSDDDEKTGKPRLLPHTPWYFTLSKVDYDYDPAATCPLWESFLHDALYPNTEYILLLQQWLGYLFRPDLNEQKFLLCYGEGANGKSVFFNVTESLVGKRNCSHLGLYGFNPQFSQFALYSTLGKTVNMSHESSHIITEESEAILKSYVSGDDMQFERKHRDPITAKPTAKIMIATNDLPRFHDKSNAIWRRILPLPFLKEVKVEHQIKDLADKLKKELPGILNWALEGMSELNKIGGFIEPEASKRIREEYRKDSDPARTFLLECCEWTENGYSTPFDELYSIYFQWCKNNGCQPMNNRFFGRSVHRVYPKAKRKRNGGRGNQAYVYDGLVVHENDNLMDYGAGRTNDEKPLF